MKILLPVLMSLCVGASGAAAQGAVPTASSAPRWDERTLHVAARLPVQDGGRVKPLDTYARFFLLNLNGRTTCRLPDGRRLSALEWFLDSWLYPERACQYPVFLVQTTEVLDALGIPHEGKRKRGRYSYIDLEPARAHMFELADDYARIDAKQRSYVQEQILNLAHAFHRLELLMHDLDFARAPLPVGDSPALVAMFGGATVPVEAVLARGGDLMRLHGEATGPAAPAAAGGDAGAVAALLNLAMTQASWARALALLPPGATPKQDPVWLTPADVFASILAGSPDPDLVERVHELERLVQQRDDGPQFLATLTSLHDAVQRRAAARGEAAKIGLEIALYHGRVLQRSQMLFLLGFVAAAFGWLGVRARLFYRLSTGALVLAAAALVTAIVLRCIIRGRPPVSTLYETVLFITSIAVITALVIESINRQRIAQALAALLGAGGLFLAARYEALERTDTMPSLVAVLDTNFWLSTHVTTITMGYAAGLLASAFAHLYLVGAVAGGRWFAADRLKSLARMTYGVVCFGLIFSVVGTILGGVWANESWGRFWGWDPKENGALMIVLWELFILHARLGGYIRDLGICLAAIFGGMIVAFSWWGVNLLGVGLHSYGFTSGAMRGLMGFYAIEVVVLGAGLVVAWRGRRARVAKPSATAPSPITAAAP